MLTLLQRRVIEIVSQLPEAHDAALAGGAAMIARGLVDRTTRDVDFFTTSADAVNGLHGAVQRALTHAGYQVRTVRAVSGFVRLEVSHRGETCEVDLAHDARLRPTERGDLGATLAAEELAADKMLALFGRAEARDFVDVDALVDHFGRERLLTLAAEKDAGFTPYRFAEALGTIDRLRPDEFGLAEDRLRHLKLRFDTWRRAITREPPELAIDGREL